MTFDLHKRQIHTLKQSDPKFVIYDGLWQAPRAGFEISQGCPKEYTMIIDECIRKGWLKPVAHVTERELIFMGLSE